MKKFLGLCFAVLATPVDVAADLCAAGSVQIGGNWYCQPVQAIRYSNVGSVGSYNQITKMSSDGSCDSVRKHFSGPLAPLNEEVYNTLYPPVRKD